MRPRITGLAAALAIAAMALGAGCGGGDGGSGTSRASLTATPDLNVPKDPKIAAEVPPAIRSSGELTVAADATYPPNEFIAKDGHTIIGMDADLAKAIGQAMGLTPKLENVTFDSIIPGLAAHKYDLGMSSFTDTKEREKTVDFVTYLTYGTLFYTNSDGPTITSLDQLCGHKVAAEKGTTQADDASAQDGRCHAAGKPDVSVEVFPDQNAVNLALSSGRAEVAMADSPVVEYIVQQSNGKFKTEGQPYGEAPYGIAIPKHSGMSGPVLDAIKAVMADGTYQKILDYWGLPGAIDNPQVNGAIS